MSPSSRIRTFEVEVLEHRLPLAGNVAAAIHGGDLVLNGDWAQNEIAIYRGTNARQVVVAGVDRGFGPTRVNGQLAPVVLSGFTGSVVGSLGAGSDKVLLSNLTVPGSVSLHGDAGSDDIALSDGLVLPGVGAFLNSGAIVPLGNVRVNHDVHLFLGSGNDSATLANVSVGDDVELHGHQGNDVLNVVEGATPRSPNVADSLLFFPGAGDDVVFANLIKVGGFLEVHDPAANLGGTVLLNQVTVNKDLNLFMSPADDLVAVRARVGNMNVHAGDGNDSLFIQLPIAQHVYMNTGAGNDAVSVTETTAKSATIDTGTGNDAVEVRFSSFDRVHAWLGTGDDQIAAQNVLVRLSVLLDGGLGFDQLSDDGGNVLNNATILNF